MTRGRRILAWTTASLVLLLAALVVFVATFDWNRIKPTLNARVSETLGRPFAINGDLSALAARALGTRPACLGALAPCDGRGPDPGQSRVGREAAVRHPQARGGEPVAAAAAVEDRGHSAHRSHRAPRRSQAPRRRPRQLDFRHARQLPEQADEEPSAWTLDIGAIGFDKGQVKVDDQPSQTRLELLVDPLGKPIPFSDIVGEKAAGKVAEQGDAPQDYAFGWTAKGSYKGQALDGSGKIGGLLALKDARKPFPLQADLRIGATRIALAGTLTDPTHLGALDLRLKLAGDSLGNLYPLTGVTLPDTPAYSTDGRLVAQLQDPAGPQFHYQGFNGAIGDSDIHGDLHYVAHPPRPKLSGALTSNQLRFADLAPLIGADSNAEKRSAAWPASSRRTRCCRWRRFAPSAGGRWMPTCASPASASSTVTSCPSTTSTPTWYSTTAS